MAKYPHRLFEMYDFHDEAVLALTPKRESPAPTGPSPQTWSLMHLSVSRAAVVMHVEFKTAEIMEAETIGELHRDFRQLADGLAKDTKVLLDFSRVASFCPTAIEAIALFKQRLGTKGSRIALCCLAPAVRESFFVTRSP